MHILAHRRGRVECSEDHTIRQLRSERYKGAASFRIFVLICGIMLARHYSSASSLSLLVIRASQPPAVGYAGAFALSAAGGGMRPRGRRRLRRRPPAPSSRPLVSRGYLNHRGPSCVVRLGPSPSASSATPLRSHSSADGSDDEESVELFPSAAKGRGAMITASDRAYMKLALERARLGFGYTYPNPAVGCVLVRSTSTPNSDEGRELVRERGLGGDVVIGTGFHPRAGMPHAEVFALLEACGAVNDGTAAAASVVEARRPSPSDDDDVAAMRTEVERLAVEYSSEGGAERLLSGCCRDDLSSDSSAMVTAYVTLEPCCHTGRTPPCATSLVHAGVDRVVVGHRDPNPRVDGGGVKLLRDAGVTVDLMSDAYDDDRVEARTIADACAGIVECFVKRITRDEVDYDSLVTGKHRSALRSLAGRRKADRTLPEISLLAGDVTMKRGTEQSPVAVVDDDVDAIFESIPGWWLEEVDTRLWSDELLLLRLGDVTPKKKLAKRLGMRIASEHLGAHVARTLGHTVLLYRPGSPPVLDLEELVASSSSSSAAK